MDFLRPFQRVNPVPYRSNCCGKIMIELRRSNFGEILQASNPRRKTDVVSVDRLRRNQKITSLNDRLSRETTWSGVWPLQKWSWIKTWTIPHQKRMVWYAQGSLLHTQPCRHRTRRLIQNIEFRLQKAIRIKYCPNELSFGITRQYSGTIAAHRAESGEPIKRFRHSALSDSALSDRQL